MFLAAQCLVRLNRRPQRLNLCWSSPNLKPLHLVSSIRLYQCRRLAFPPPLLSRPHRVQDPRHRVKNALFHHLPINLPWVPMALPIQEDQHRHLLSNLSRPCRRRNQCPRLTRAHLPFLHSEECRVGSQLRHRRVLYRRLSLSYNKNQHWHR